MEDESYLMKGIPWYQTLGGITLLGGLGLFFAFTGVSSCVRSFREERKVQEYEMDLQYQDDARARRSFLTEQLKHPDITPEARAEILKEFARGPQ